MKTYRAKPTSRITVRGITELFRHVLEMEEMINFPIVKVLDKMCETFEGFSYEIVPDYSLGYSKHAEIDVERRHIRIEERVYEGACDGNGRDRMTIAHEIGHYILICVLGYNVKEIDEFETCEAYRDPEWQAKCFAGELLVDYKLTEDMMPEEIMENCGVSYDAAVYQYNHRK